MLLVVVFCGLRLSHTASRENVSVVTLGSMFASLHLSCGCHSVGETSPQEEDGLLMMISWYRGGPLDVYSARHNADIQVNSNILVDQFYSALIA